MTDAEALDLVLGTVGLVSEVAEDELRTRLDDNLIYDLGVDSIRMMRIWVEIEKSCNLEPGDLGFTQVATISGIVDQVLERGR